DQLRIQFLTGIIGGAMLSAASALDAGIGLERRDAGNIFSRNKAEVFIARKRRNVAESAAVQENCERAQDQMKVLRVRNQRQETDERKGVNPPEGMPAGR